jgi:hypothetical protein
MERLKLTWYDNLNFHICVMGRYFCIAHDPGWWSFYTYREVEGREEWFSFRALTWSKDGSETHGKKGWSIER